MANTVLQIRRSSVAGRTPNTTTSANTQFINQGELALNMADFKMFSSNGTAFFEIGANTSTKFVSNGTATGFTANSTGAYANVVTANNITASNNLTFPTGSKITDSLGSQGTAGQVLTSNGTGNVYWSTVSGGGGSVNVNSTYSFTNTITFSNSISLPVGARILDALGSQGTAGQVLTSNGTGNVYWSTVSGGGGSVNTAAQYTFTNTISFSANVNIVGNATSTLVVGNTTVYTTVNAVAVYGSSTNTTVTANGFVSTFDGTGNLTVPNTFYVGTLSGNVSMGGTQNYSFGNLVALFSGSGNTSLEFSAFIANTGNNASVSFSVYDTSTGPNGNNFVIIGMNGNNFAQPWWSINGKSDGYVYTGNTNLSVGTQGNNYLNFFAGNTFANNEMMRINPNYTMTTNATMTQQKYSGQIYAIQNGFALT